MSKRRIRNLYFLGYKDIVGFDVREDRQFEAKKEYGIDVISELDFTNVDVCIISTPPDSHGEYAKKCIELGIHCFMELNVFDWGIDEVIKLAKEKNILVAPSYTARNYSLVRKMKVILETKQYGKPLTFTCHSGQYLLDWHPWEGLNFFMSDKRMGGTLERASWDLVWITWLFGYPIWQTGTLDKVSDLDADIYDILSLTMRFENNVIGNLMTDVISRVDTRIMKIFCEEAVLTWEWGKQLTVESDNMKNKVEILPEETVTSGNYSSKIKEEPYIAEIQAFIDAVEGKKDYPYTLKEVKKRLEILEVLRKQNES